MHFFWVNQKPIPLRDQSVASAVGASGSNVRTPCSHCLIISSFDAKKADSSSWDQWNGILDDKRWRNGCITGAIANEYDI